MEIIIIRDRKGSKNKYFQNTISKLIKLLLLTTFSTISLFLCFFFYICNRVNKSICQQKIPK